MIKGERLRDPILFRIIMTFFPVVFMDSHVLQKCREPLKENSFPSKKGLVNISFDFQAVDRTLA